jgi:hypothetical protein
MSLVLWRPREIYDHTFFSPMSGIYQDLGGMEVRAPAYRGGSGGGAAG